MTEAFRIILGQPPTWKLIISYVSACGCNGL